MDQTREPTLSLTELNKRMQQYNTEYTVRSRHRLEAATTAHKAIQSIPEETFEAMKKICPEVAIIKEYTMDDLHKNRNGEIKLVSQVIRSLQSYLEAWLLEAEENL